MSDFIKRLEFERKRVAAFRDELESYVLLDGVSRAAKDKIWDVAWEHGHASGFDEVRSFYEDFAEIAVLAAAGGAE